VGLIAELLNDRLDFPVALSDHLVFNFSLSFNLCVLRLLHHLGLQLFMLNLQSLPRLLDFNGMLPLRLLELVLERLTFLLNLSLGALLH